MTTAVEQYQKSTPARSSSRNAISVSSHPYTVNSSSKSPTSRSARRGTEALFVTKYLAGDLEPGASLCTPIPSR